MLMNQVSSMIKPEFAENIQPQVKTQFDANIENNIAEIVEENQSPSKRQHIEVAEEEELLADDLSINNEPRSPVSDKEQDRDDADTQNLFNRL